MFVLGSAASAAASRDPFVCHNSNSIQRNKLLPGSGNTYATGCQLSKQTNRQTAGRRAMIDLIPLRRPRELVSSINFNSISESDQRQQAQRQQNSIVPLSAIVCGLAWIGQHNSVWQDN